MDLGYVIVEKFKKNDLEIWDMFETEEGNVLNVEIDNGKSGSEGTVWSYENDKESSEGRQRSVDDNNGPDRHNGETAEVQGMGREQDGKRSAQDHGNRDNKHGVEDRQEVISSSNDVFDLSTEGGNPDAKPLTIQYLINSGNDYLTS